MKKHMANALIGLLLVTGCNSPTASTNITDAGTQTQQQPKAAQENQTKIEVPVEKEQASVPVEPKPVTTPPAPITDAPEPTKKAEEPKPAKPEPAKEIPKTTNANPKPPSSPLPIEEKQQETVKLSITGDSEHGVILPMTEVQMEKGDSVLDVLQKALKEKGILMEYSGTKGMAYVEGIDNLYEFDHGPKSGWMFRVNGTFASRSAGSYAIQPGDQIEWHYTLDLGRDLGAQVTP